MIYLLLGSDVSFKDKHILDIKKKHLPSYDTLSFDFEVLQGAKLSAENLKKSLMALPALASKRVVLLREVEKLSAQNKDIILDFADSGQSTTVLILDALNSAGRNAFFTKLSRKAQVLKGGFEEAPRSVFDMTNAISARQTDKALLVLYQLLQEGQHPLQLMGVLVWFWGKQRGRVSDKFFQQGLLLLKEADLNIKRSRLKPEYAVEKLVVGLGELV